MTELDGKVIIVTGAGRGIGREHALLLASHGALVVVNDLGVGVGGDGVGASQSPANEVVEEIRAAGGEAVANGEDVSTWAGGAGLVKLAIETFGGLDGLVNNAGILRDAMFVNLTEDDWDASIAVNLKGHAAPTRAAAEYWRGRAKTGDTVRASVVNTSSESGVFGNPGQSNYAAAKGAIATLTMVWSKELARYGVRVNSVLPRARTRLTEASFANGSSSKPAPSFDKWHPGNVSPFVAYLLSDGCPLSGEAFIVGGGLVHHVVGWSLDDRWKLRKDGRWTVAELAEEVERVGVPVDERATGLIK